MYSVRVFSLSRMPNGKATANPARLVRRRRENNAVIRYLLPEEEQRSHPGKATLLAGMIAC